MQNPVSFKKKLMSPAIITLTIAMWTVASCQEAPLEAGDINDIVKLLKNAQQQNVRESFGKWEGQCFTDRDYDAFRRNERPLRIAQQLKGNRKFMEAVIALKAMPEKERVHFIEGCRRPLRPTWAQLGRISREGQTVAGQQAELEIADAVAETALELLKLSHDDIFTVFKKH